MTSDTGLCRSQLDTRCWRAHGEQAQIVTMTLCGDLAQVQGVSLAGQAAAPGQEPG